MKTFTAEADVLYEKRGRRYYPVRGRFDFDTLPLKKEVIVISHNEHSRSFMYAELPINEEKIKISAAARRFQDELFKELQDSGKWEIETPNRPLTPEEFMLVEKLRELFDKDAIKMTKQSKHDIVEKAVDNFLSKYL
jgi:hypothetical protein